MDAINGATIITTIITRKSRIKYLVYVYDDFPLLAMVETDFSHQQKRGVLQRLHHLRVQLRTAADWNVFISENSGFPRYGCHSLVPKTWSL